MEPDRPVAFIMVLVPAIVRFSYRPDWPPPSIHPVSHPSIDFDCINPSMALLSRVSAVAGRSSRCSARSQLTRIDVVAHPSKSSSTGTLARSITTQPAAAENASSIASTGRFSAFGSFLLGTTVIAAGAGTVYFTYLRLKSSGWAISANTIMDDGLHPAEYPWPNKHPFASFDHARYLIPRLLRDSIAS